MVKQRTTVHFVVDIDAVLMMMRLAGNDTHVLPFSKGDGAARAIPPIRRAAATTHGAALALPLEAQGR